MTSASSIEAAPAEKRSGGNRLAELDGLRGLAILLVVAWHYFFGPNFNWNSPAQLAPMWARPFALTWSGVELFFVLSGFLLTNVLLDAKGSPNYYRTFYLRRAYRILPLYLMVLVPFAIFHLLGSLGETDTLPLWAYATFTQNIVGSLKGDFGFWWMGVTWSLAIEEHFYLVLPVLVRRLSMRGLTALSIATIIAAPLLRAWVLTSSLPDAVRWHTVYFATPCRLDALAYGVLAAILFRTAVPRALPAILAILAALNVRLLIEGWDIHSVRSGAFGFSLLEVFYAALLLFIVSRPDSVLARLIRLPALIALGSLSYAIYLFHCIVLWTGHLLLNANVPTSSSPKALGISLGALAVTICAALLSKRLIEAPAMRLARSLRY